jgi:hypothetical protein
MLPAALLWLEFHRLRSTPKGEEERSVGVQAVPKVPTTRKFLLMLEGLGYCGCVLGEGGAEYLYECQYQGPDRT